VPMDPPKETTAVRDTATRGDARRVLIDPPAAMAGEEWHPEDPEEEDLLIDEEEEPCHVETDIEDREATHPDDMDVAVAVDGNNE